jgi:hypothetical protein
MLQAALRKAPSVEVQRRLARLLSGLAQNVVSPELARARRAVEAAERMDGPEARQFLEGLAEGAEDDPVTLDAKAALARLARRAP